EGSDWVFVTPNYGLADFEGEPPPKGEPGVKALLSALGDLRVESDDDFEPLGAKLADLGLETGKAPLTVKVERTGGKGKVSETLLIGNKIGDKYYARLANDPAAVKVSAKKLETVFKLLQEPQGLRSHDLVRLPPDSADALRLSQGKDLKEVVRLYKTSPTQ